MNFTKAFFVIIIAANLLTACKSKVKDSEDVIPASTLYASGIKDLEAGEYKKATEQFEKVFFQHPGNSITPQAELMHAYSLYLTGEHEEAADVLDMFIKLHPRHENIAYAYYLKALAYYVQISDVRLDQSKTSFAREALEEVIEKFPGSKYAIDAALKIDLVNDHLAGKEMFVGRYYLNKKNPIAAIKRFQVVIKHYNTTSHAPECLYRLVESNMMLGLVDEAKKYADVLAHNYADNQWTKYCVNLLK